MSEQELKRLTREELNARAAKRGIDAAELPTKEAVIEAMGRATPGEGPVAARSQTARRLPAAP